RAFSSAVTGGSTRSPSAGAAAGGASGGRRPTRDSTSRTAPTGSSRARCTERSSCSKRSSTTSRADSTRRSTDRRASSTKAEPSTSSTSTSDPVDRRLAEDGLDLDVDEGGDAGLAGPFEGGPDLRRLLHPLPIPAEALDHSL